MTPEQRWLADVLALAQRTGWSLESVERLDVIKYRHIVSLLDGLDRARAFVRQNPRAWGL